MDASECRRLATLRSGPEGLEGIRGSPRTGGVSTFPPSRTTSPTHKKAKKEQREPSPGSSVPSRPQLSTPSSGSALRLAHLTRHCRREGRASLDSAPRSYPLSREARVHLCRVF